MQYRTVADVEIVPTRQNVWRTKSNGKLEVLFAFSADKLAIFLDTDNLAFHEYPVDIRGLRSYTVSDLKQSAKGAMEWHKARTEYVSVLAGSVKWTCIDLEGTEKEVILDHNTAVITPPTIMHMYEALEDNTTIQVVANTLFFPNNPATHDSYSLESFYDAMKNK